MVLLEEDFSALIADAAEELLSALLARSLDVLDPIVHHHRHLLVAPVDVLNNFHVEVAEHAVPVVLRVLLAEEKQALKGLLIGDLSFLTDESEKHPVSLAHLAAALHAGQLLLLQHHHFSEAGPLVGDLDSCFVFDQLDQSDVACENTLVVVALLRSWHSGHRSFIVDYSRLLIVQLEDMTVQAGLVGDLVLRQLVENACEEWSDALRRLQNLPVAQVVYLGQRNAAILKSSHV